MVQFAQGVEDGREYAVKFFLDDASFYAEAALYVAVFPHLKRWLSDRATQAMSRLRAPGEHVEKAGQGVQSMHSAGSRFLPQVLPLVTPSVHVRCGRCSIVEVEKPQFGPSHAVIHIVSCVTPWTHCFKRANHLGICLRPKAETVTRTVTIWLVC